MKNIYKALFKIKSEVGAISKDSKNPFFKSKYFDINNLLQHIEPILQKHGVLCLQPVENGKVVTMLIHTDSEEIVSSEMLLPELTDPQKLGSAITYYRRYTLGSLLALQAEDDDGNKAAAPVKKAKPTLKSDTAEYRKVFEGLRNGFTMEQVKVKYTVSKEIESQLIKELGNGKV